MNTRKTVRVVCALVLALCMFLGANLPSFAKGKSASNPTIKKSSQLYQELVNGMFDYDFYKEQNPDVVKAFGNNKTRLLNHFTTYGIFEGRRPNADFDVNVYASAYDDLRKAYSSFLDINQQILCYYNHYISYGRDEKRDITTTEKAANAGISVSKIGSSETVAPPWVPTSLAPAAIGAENYNNLAATFCFYTDKEVGLTFHSFGEGRVVIPADDDSCAVIERKCTKCGYTRVSQEHDEHTVIVENATSEKDGYSVLSCVNCGRVRDNVSKETIHFFSPFEYVDCDDDTKCGYRQLRCVNCGYCEIDTFYHSKMEYIVTKELTETEDGILTRICPFCNVTLGSTILHDESGEWVYVPAASKYENDRMELRCKNCGDLVCLPRYIVKE